MSHILLVGSVRVGYEREWDVVDALVSGGVGGGNKKEQMDLTKVVIVFGAIIMMTKLVAS